jgi:hypothetical protein
MAAMWLTPSLHVPEEGMRLGMSPRTAFGSAVVSRARLRKLPVWRCYGITGRTHRWSTSSINENGQARIAKATTAKPLFVPAAQW